MLVQTQQMCYNDAGVMLFPRQAARSSRITTSAAKASAQKETMMSRKIPSLLRISFLLRLFFLAAGLTAPAFSASAATLGVPAQYPTIQAAVNASASGDTVLIADGTYTGPGNVDVDFSGKNITVTSQHGAASTIINCQGSASVTHRGFYLHSGETSAAISGLTIENGYAAGFDNSNPATGRGGGILIYGASASVLSCTLKNNTAGVAGGGISAANFYTGGVVSVANCSISGNSAGGGGLGGGVETGNSSGTITFTGCTISGNTANYGGGVFNGNSGSGTIALINCAVTSNTVFSGGGGVYNDTYGSTGSSAISLTNCTLTGNTTSIGGGGGVLNFLTGSTAILTNCIVYGDAGGEVDRDPSSTLAASLVYCDVQGGSAGTGNIDADPQFLSPPADLHLQPGSHCLGAGTASGAPKSTLDGRLRPSPPSIGAYEAATGSTLSVPAQYPTIQAAVNAAQSGDTVLIADGTYTGPGNVDVDFSGKNITVTSQHGAASTIINCGGTVSANHRGFYLHSGETSAVISGLTIENGYEDLYGATNGGAIETAGVGVTITSCAFRNNEASYGAGISVSNDGPVRITNCVFTGNLATEGAGIDNIAYPGGATTVSNCTFTSNQVYGDGGALYSYTSTGTPIALTNDIFYGDTILANSSNPVTPSEVLTFSGFTASDCDVQGGLAGTGNINADPQFAGAPADLHLLAGSPCLGAGTPNGAPALTIDGRTRPNPPSIGAYEVYLPPPTTTVASLSGTPGQAVTLRASLGFPGAAGLAGKTLSFSVDGVSVGTAVTSSGGAASLLYTIPLGAAAGSHTISAAFAGDAGSSASSGTGTLNVYATRVQINAGGGASGPFAADTDVTGGSTYATGAAIDTSGVVIPAPQAVYQTERYGNFTYTVPNLTPGASYTLRLHFAEVYWNAAGRRLFNVAVNGSPALTNFDIFAAAGGANKAVVETIPVTADANGKVTVTFSTLKDNAKLSGLELTAAPATQTPVAQINAGGAAAGSFAADTEFYGGSTYATSAAISTSGVTSPAPPAVYQTERYGSFTYTVPNLTPGASYTLRLHFAEIYWNSAGQRVFNVSVNETAVLTNFDIFAAAGGANKAVIETIPVTADANGKVTIAFTTVKDNAKLSGLELLH